MQSRELDGKGIPCLHDLGRIDRRTVDDLQELGHELEDWTGAAGRIIALLAYFHGTGTPSFRMSLYGDAGGLPADLLAVVEGQAPGAQGWHEFALDPAHYLDVTGTTVLWIGAQSSANIDSRGPSGGAANSGRRLRAFTFGNGAPSPFGSSSTYNNTRGLRMKIWINP
jgi:hypothetical protein